MSSLGVRGSIVLSSAPEIRPVSGSLGSQLGPQIFFNLFRIQVNTKLVGVARLQDLERDSSVSEDQTEVNIREWAGRRKQKSIRRLESRSKRLRCLFGIPGQAAFNCFVPRRSWHPRESGLAADPRLLPAVR